MPASAWRALEFIVTNHIGIHPMALARYPKLKDPQAVKEIAARIGEEDPREFFIRRLSEGVARIAAAFYPKPVIVRTSDFKTNEYARLLGGREFEPQEENPMIGLPGRVTLLRPALRRGLRPGMRGARAGAARDGVDERQSDDPVLPHGRRRQARDRSDGGQRLEAGRGRPRGLRDVRAAVERRVWRTSS